MVEALEVMNGTHLELRSFTKIYTDGCVAKSKKDVTLLLNILTDFEFIVGIITLYRLMHPIAPVTKQLQKRAVDVINTYTGVMDYISVFDYLCNSAKGEFLKIC